MVTYAADTFDRANGAIGTSDGPGSLVWSTSSSWVVSSNLAASTGATVDEKHTAWLAVGQANVTVSADVTLSSTSNRACCGIVLRYADTANCLRVYLIKSTAIANSVNIEDWHGGGGAILASFTSAGLVNGNTYNLQAVISGTTIKVLLDGVQKIAPTAFNSGLTTQNYGLNIYKGSVDYDDSGARFNNFLVTDNATTRVEKLHVVTRAARERVLR